MPGPCLKVSTRGLVLGAVCYRPWAGHDLGHSPFLGACWDETAGISGRGLLRQNEEGECDGLGPRSQSLCQPAPCPTPPSSHRGPLEFLHSGGPLPLLVPGSLLALRCPGSHRSPHPTLSLLEATPLAASSIGTQLGLVQVRIRRRHSLIPGGSLAWGVQRRHGKPV